MSDEVLNSETCTECGRQIMIEDAAAILVPGPQPVVPVQPTPAAQTQCEACGHLLLDT